MAEIHTEVLGVEALLDREYDRVFFMCNEPGAMTKKADVVELVLLGLKQTKKKKIPGKGHHGHGGHHDAPAKPHKKDNVP